MWWIQVLNKLQQIGSLHKAKQLHNSNVGQSWDNENLEMKSALALKSFYLCIVLWHSVCAEMPFSKHEEKQITLLFHLTRREERKGEWEL